MICLRCGWCCINLEVVIPKEGIDFDNIDFDIEDSWCMKHTGDVCPHLLEQDGKAFCKLHHYPWFQDTPCGQYTQIGREDAECRMGRAIMDGRLPGVVITSGKGNEEE